jgi:hypothetical protein
MADNKNTMKKYDDINSVTLGGRLTGDAEIKTGEKDGRKWKQVRFSYACNRKGETMYINCSIFVPETFQAKGFVKGAQVSVAGKLSVKMGEKRPFIDIEPHSLDDIQISRGAAPAAKAEEPAEAAEATTDQDIPF